MTVARVQYQDTGIRRDTPSTATWAVAFDDAPTAGNLLVAISSGDDISGGLAMVNNNWEGPYMGRDAGADSTDYSGTADQGHSWVALWYRIADGSADDGPTVTMTTDPVVTNRGRTCTIAEYSGDWGSDPMDIFDAHDVDPHGTGPYGSATPTKVGDLRLCAMFMGGNTTSIDPTVGNLGLTSHVLHGVTDTPFSSPGWFPSGYAVAGKHSVYEGLTSDYDDTLCCSAEQQVAGTSHFATAGVWMFNEVSAATTAARAPETAWGGAFVSQAHQRAAGDDDYTISSWAPGVGNPLDGNFLVMAGWLRDGTDTLVDTDIILPDGFELLDGPTYTHEQSTPMCYWLAVKAGASAVDDASLDVHYDNRTPANCYGMVGVWEYDTGGNFDIIVTPRLHVHAAYGAVADGFRYSSRYPSNDNGLDKVELVIWMDGGVGVGSDDYDEDDEYVAHTDMGGNTGGLQFHMRAIDRFSSEPGRIGVTANMPYAANYVMAFGIAESPPIQLSGPLEVPQTRLNLKVLPNKVSRALLDGFDG